MAQNDAQKGRMDLKEGLTGRKWNVLVTGGAGYVGSMLVPKLLAAGHRVSVLDLYLYGDVFADLAGNPMLRQVKGDLRDPAAVRKALDGCDAVIHLASLSAWDQIDSPLNQDDVQRNLGTMLGSGSIVAMDETTCMVRAAWRITKFFHRESCGQCTPCREGSGWLDKIMLRIEQGQGRPSDLDLLLDVCDNIAPGLSWPPRQTTICPLGPSIPSSIVSAIRMFRDEFLVHIKEGACPYGH